MLHLINRFYENDKTKAPDLRSGGLKEREKMGKIKRIFGILFGDEIAISQGVPMEEIGFGPPTTKDTRLQFDRKAIMGELKVPPIKIEKTKIPLKILEVKKIISSLEKKKMDVSVYKEALVQLKNRTLLNSEIQKHIDSYPVTTHEKIEHLSSKYKLMFRNLGGVTRDIPLGAIKAIDQICKPFEKNKISFNKGNFFLIAPEDWWQKKRDPILIMRSPFGNYYYILYAWDKEVNIVSELFDD